MALLVASRRLSCSLTVRLAGTRWISTSFREERDTFGPIQVPSDNRGLKETRAALYSRFWRSPMPRVSFTDTGQGLVSILQACTDMAELKQILSQVIVCGLWSNGFIISRMVSFCVTSESGDVHFGRFLFDRSECQTAFAYNVMIRHYSNSDTPDQCLQLFREMLNKQIYADKHAFPFVLKACSRTTSFFFGRAVHSLLVKCGFEGDVYILTSLIHMYASTNCVDLCEKVFDEMPQRSIVTWNAMISCFLKKKCEVESLGLFREMVAEGLDLNEDTLVSASSCCASLGLLSWGKCVHAFAIRKEAQISRWVELATSLVYMYVKCGSLESGVRVFEKMPKRDVLSWTAMIGGLAMHGLGKEAISLFDRMVKEGIKPDNVTFTSLLHTCSHSGLVHEGVKIFNTMIKVYRIEAREEHYGCMVDLLARAGLYEDAQLLVKSMHFEPSEVVWGSFVNACVVNGEVKLGEQIGKDLLELGIPSLDGAHYVAMSNVLAMGGRWNEVCQVRRAMVGSGMKKVSGFSSIEVNGRVHQFLLGDTKHPLTTDIYLLLDAITIEMTQFG